MKKKMLKRILIVFGTRPEAIKMAPLIKEFENYKNDFEVKVCVTAQHRSMLDQVLDIFDINVDYDLDIMKHDQDLYDVTSKVLLNLRNVLREINPELVLVQGDTTTTFATSLASFYEKISIGHVEAGLRTGNIYSPWPEEMNRKLTSCIAKYHFPPTETSKKNLLDEGVDPQSLFVTGNTVIDALFMVVERIKDDKMLTNRIKSEINQKGYNVSNIYNGKKLILVTGHRRENFGEGFINICEALKEVAIRYEEFDILYPVHLNPNVQKPVYKILSDLKNVFLIEPIDYLPFVYLMSKSYIIITDSGGVQEEAPSLGKPVLVMRDTTERPEAVDAGTVKIVGTDKDRIVKETGLLIENRKIYNEMSKAHNPYGDGKACQRILNILKRELQ